MISFTQKELSIIQGALRCAVVVYENDAREANSYSARVAEQFRAQAAAAAALNERIECES